MAKIAFLFPGQGAQVVGMGKDIYENNEVARTFFDEANASLDFDLKELVFNGPLEKLSLTEYTQPALVAVEIMLLKVLAEKDIKPDVVAGLSLGEYSALVAAGSLAPLTAVELTRIRGQIMSSALPVGTTTMAAVLGMESDVLSTLCEEANPLGIVEIANYNCPGQLVIGGHVDAVEKVSKLATENGARKVIPLNVSGAFHTSLLKEAGEKLRGELEKIQFKNLEIPVIFNKTADYQNEPIINLLEAQLSSAVKFQATIELMIQDGVDTFIEVGPGRSLLGFIKKIDRRLAIYQVEDSSGINELVEKLGGEK